MLLSLQTNLLLPSCEQSQPDAALQCNVIADQFGQGICGANFSLLLRSLNVSLVFCRSGSIFNSGFLRRMLVEAVQHGLDEAQPLLKTLVCEAECTTSKLSTHSPSDENKQGKNHGKTCHKKDRLGGELGRFCSLKT